MSKQVRLDEDQETVLAFLANTGGSCDACFSFGSIGADTGLDRRRVRLACRSLKRLGFAFYARGLWNDDGEPRGAGYGLTRAGLFFAQSAGLA